MLSLACISEEKHGVPTLEKLESWLSGRKRLTANEVGGKTPRGFESRTLRCERSEQGE